MLVVILLLAEELCTMFR